MPKVKSAEEENLQTIEDLWTACYYWEKKGNPNYFSGFERLCQTYPTLEKAYRDWQASEKILDLVLKGLRDNPEGLRDNPDGSFMIAGKVIRVHRYSYSLHASGSGGRRIPAGQLDLDGGGGSTAV